MTTVNHIEVIQELYRAFQAKDYNRFLQICTPDLEWIQNEGFPNGSIYRGASEVVENVFKVNDSNWKDFSYQIEQMLDAGNSVVVIGRYRGTHRISGKSMSAAAAHIYDLRDGRRYSALEGRSTFDFVKFVAFGCLLIQKQFGRL